MTIELPVTNNAFAREILTVAQLNQAVGQLLERSIPALWVRGEISNFTQAASGHWYFTLKDSRAAVRAVMFRSRASAVGFVPRAGDQVEIRARVSLYEPRGDYQLQADAMRRAGLGNLYEAFLRLKEQLASEGLFDPARKREPVRLPRAIGVITSLHAAALRDVLSALARRAPQVPVIIYPAPVQGADAASKLAAQLRLANERAEVDTLLLVRGGGSIEDLWSFNDEDLARQVAVSEIPVISGVGHETDFTIVDFVSDLRAPTPTAAAELACAPRAELLGHVMQTLQTMVRGQQRRLERAAQRLDRATAQLVSPAQRLQHQRERLNSLQYRLASAWSAP
ncbi:exodeoxyribonuclease VII large subunit, partial [Achromobacter sp. KAs 3-5]